MALGSRTIATLGVKLDPGDAVRQGERLDATLDKLAGSAAGAEKAVKGLGSATERELEGKFRAAERQAAQLERELDRIERQRRANAERNSRAIVQATVLAAAAVAAIGAKVIGDAIENSERATAAGERLGETYAEMAGVIGDSLAPGLESLAGSFERLATNQSVVALLQAIGEGFGFVAEMIGKAAENYEEAFSEAFLEGSLLISGLNDQQKQQIRDLWQTQREYDAFRAKNGAGAAKGKSYFSEADQKRALAEVRRQNNERLEQEAQAQERARRVAEAKAKADQALIDKYDELGAGIRRLAEEEARIQALHRQGSLVGAAYAAATDKLTEARRKLLETGTSDGAFDPLPTQSIGERLAAVETITTETAKAAELTGHTKRDWEGMVNLAGAIGAEIGRWNEELGFALESVASIAQIFMQMQGASGAQAGLGGLAMGSAIGGLGQGFGFWQGDRGRSKFGGRRSGDYGDAGASIGGAIGGVIGSVALMGPWGAAIGSAIGSIIGGALGGAIKKGADEGIVHIKAAAGGAAYQIRKNESGLGDAAKGIGESIVRSVTNISTALGGSLEGIADIGIKIRDDVVSVVVDGVKRRFEEVDEAIGFAVAEALKRSEISGLDPLIRAGLSGSSAESLEELEGDVAALQTVLGFAIGEVALAARQGAAELDVLRNEMSRLLAGTDQLGRALEAINLQEISRWSDLRDSITGRQKSPAELRKEKELEAELFNAEKALRIADLKSRYADLQAKREVLIGEILVRQSELETGREFLSGKGKLLQFEAELGGAFLGTMSAAVGASLAALDAQMAALGKLIEGLGKIPDIDLGEIKIGGGTTIGGRLSEIRSVLEQIRDNYLRRQTSDLNPGGLGDQIAEARRQYERFSRMADSDNYRTRLEGLRGLSEAGDRLLELFRQGYGSTSGEYANLWDRINERERELLRRHGIDFGEKKTPEQLADYQAEAFSKRFKYASDGSMMSHDKVTADRTLAVANATAAVASLAKETRDELRGLRKDLAAPPALAPTLGSNRRREAA